MDAVTDRLSVILANTYVLYLKTQNYHWHVRGPHFYSLHQLFEMQYLELAAAVDGIAERMLMMNQKAPATFQDYLRLMTLKEGDSQIDADKMIRDLAHDHQTMVRDVEQAMALAQAQKDEGSITLLSERISAHEKAHWMLSASCR
ncbi:MAG: DNA starvation/stationary phase protection protein [Legionellales bacterium]|nr:DNA starvation/stationary phase protection protein [Legionellales bacterium]